MRNIIPFFDDLTGIPSEGGIALHLDRIIFVFLVLMFVSAPHSIAATQIAWLTGMFLWLIRLIFKPRIRFRFTFFDAALLGLLVWSAVSGFMSYDPPTSIDRLRVVALLLIFYFVFYNIRNLRAAYFLGFALVFSCMVNVAWTPVQRWLGRGVEIHGLQPEGPLAKAGFIEGDTLDRANGKVLRTPDDAVAQISKNDITTLEFYRGDFETDAKIKRDDLLDGADSRVQLGIESWKVGSIIRANGFYRHYVTYAETLQLFGSLVFGLFVAAFSRSQKKDSRIVLGGVAVPAWAILLAVFGCMSLVLLLTVTRSSQLALMFSAFAILVASRNKKLLIVMAAVAIPVAIGALIYLQQRRHVGFLDLHDESTQYRQVMWRDGFRLWTASPRNFIFGVGMDSIKAHWQEWNMFDGGRLPVSHFHSTPIQLLVERGLPALLLWIAAIFFYFRTLVHGIRRQLSESGDWRALGLMLGCFGGAIGFFVSGLVQYNLGDSVVAMIFFLLMGLGSRVADISQKESASA